MFPNEKRELSADWWDAQKTRQKGRLCKKVVQRAAKKGGSGCRKGQPCGLPFSATLFLMCSLQAPLNVQPTSQSCIRLVQPAGPLFYAARQPADNSCFLFGNTARPALRLVLSLTVAPQAGQRFPDKVTFFFVLRHATRPNLRLQA